MAARKKLYRSDTNRRLAGICGGLEDYTGIDATIWRLVFVAFTLPGGIPGPLVYLLMWIVVPPRS